MKRLMLVLAPALLVMVAAAALPTTQAFAQDQNIEQMTENAKTPADYEAISAYYTKKADEAQQQLTWHESLYKTYKQNPRLSTMQMHCHRLVRIYKNQVKEYRVMADQYSQLAKKPQ
jgi:hypothetical protein